tara:strand:- start:64 stop:405 length:342 start_codon:yes stop_codon:yes gene_type:complete
MIVGVELVIAVAAVGGVIITGISQAVAWRRNGSHQVERDVNQAKVQAARDAIMTSHQEEILRRLGNMESGLQAVNTKIAGMQTDWASVSSTFAEQLKGHNRDIQDIKNRPRTI